MQGVRTQLFVIFAVLIHESLMQQFVDGPCPTVKTVRNFNLQKYLGRHYQHSLYASTLSDYKCGQAYYNEVDERSVEIIIRGQNVESNSTRVFHFNCEIINGPNWSCNVPGIEHSGTNVNYQIIYTDYVNYTVIFSCELILGGLRHLETIWVTSRQRTLTPEFEDMANGVIDRNGFDSTALVRDKCELN